MKVANGTQSMSKVAPCQQTKNNGRIMFAFNSFNGPTKIYSSQMKGPLSKSKQNILEENDAVINSYNDENGGLEMQFEQ